MPSSMNKGNGPPPAIKPKVYLIAASLSWPSLGRPGARCSVSQAICFAPARPSLHSR
jgi:hypothetical protein